MVSNHQSKADGRTGSSVTDESGATSSSDEDGEERDVVELLCSRCGGPLYFDPEAETDPQACMCESTERPDGWHIIEKSEAVARAEEFL